MIQFKEIVFVRVKGQGKVLSKIDEARNAIRKIMDWSFVVERQEIFEAYMNYENKAIYNSGLIVRRLENGEY